MPVQRATGIARTRTHDVTLDRDIDGDREKDTPPSPAKDAIQDVQLRGLTRWGPRRAGLPAVLDWWPAYFVVCVVALLAVLITARTIVEVLHPFGHVLVVASVAAVLAGVLVWQLATEGEWFSRQFNEIPACTLSARSSPSASKSVA